MTDHPLYADEELVRQETQRHLDAGLTTFQLWLTQPTERLHARWVLGQLDPPYRARVLSLGCGVAGMEALWLAEQPDLRFTLVNVSLAQLDLSMCWHMRFCMDAMHFAPVGKFDVIVLAYAAGHLDYALLIARAKGWLAEEGQIVVLDIFDVEPETQRLLHYNAPTTAAVTEAGFKQVEVPEWHLHAPMQREAFTTQAAIEATKPAMWVYRA